MFEWLQKRLPELGIRQIKRVIVFVVGMTVLLVGVASIFLPLLPAIVIIPAGLVILGMEFAWARRWLRKARSILEKTTANNNANKK